MRWPGRARAADRFAGAVDTGDGRPGTELAGLVAVVRRLREVDGTSGPEPTFRAGLRERLVQTAAAEWAARAPAEPTTPAAEPTAEPVGRPPGRWVRTRFALAGALAVALAVTGLVLVSGSALPGDPLYPVKRATERVELAFTFGQGPKGRRYLAAARSRVQEIQALLDRNGSGPDPGTVSGALDAMDGQTAAGTRLLNTAAVRQGADGPLADLTAWTAEQQSLLGALLDRLPAPARARAAESLDLLRRVAERATALRSELSCSCLGAAGTDDLGPRPCAPCAAGPGGLPSPGAPGSPTPSGGAGAPGAGPATPTGGAGGSPGASGGPGAGSGSPSGRVGVPLPVPTGSGGLPLPTVPGLPLPTGTLPLPTGTLPLPTGTLPLPLPLPSGTLPLPLPTGPPPLPLPT